MGLIDKILSIEFPVGIRPFGYLISGFPVAGYLLVIRVRHPGVFVL